MATSTKSVDFEAILTKWQRDVDEVLRQIEGWFRSHSDHPDVILGTLHHHETNLPEYDTKLIRAIFGKEYSDHIEVRPGGRNYPWRGDIVITSHSNLRRAVLLQNESDSGWTIYSDSNLKVHLELNQHDFYTLIDDLRAEL